MKNIDFLPERYHERDLKRKAAIWQYSLLIGFGGMLLAATIGQLAIKRSLEASLAELKPSRIDTNVKRERSQLLRQQLDSAEQSAALYTYLRHPWPRTQLIASITDLLPESVFLDEVELVEQAPQRSAFAGDGAADEFGGPTPAAADLARLRHGHDAGRLVIRIRGSVDDTAALNEYVGRLGGVALFRGVSLSSLQSRASRGELAGSSFELNAVVRPGHGQPDGPNGPLRKRAQLARHSLGGPSQ